VELLFLGTGGSVPTPERNTVAIALRHGPEVLLFDCGEGTQRQFMRSSFSYMKVTRVFVTHLHGDHFLGLPGLIQTMNFNGRGRPLSIYGPEGTIEMVEGVLKLGLFDLGFDVVAQELSDAEEVEGNDFTVKAIKVDHTVPALGYVFEERGSTGRFMPERAKDLGVPEGPLFARLQAGEEVEVDDGVVTPDMVLGPSRTGMKFSYSGDTRPCEGFMEAARGSDVMVHEATVDSSLYEKAKAFGHSTAEEAARLAHRAGVRRLYLVHFSGRYEDPSILLEEAVKYFSESYLAADLMVVDIRRQ
jgi:ribonuclease Z